MPATASRNVPAAVKAEQRFVTLEL
jgi:hypothetical protein